MRFDIFTIQSWREGYILRVGIIRPHNAPRFRHTSADRQRDRAVIKENYRMSKEEVMYQTLEEVVEAIKKYEE